jgi:hypothetical protein
MALRLRVGTVRKSELVRVDFHGMKDVVFKFRANGSGYAVVTWSEHKGFPLPTMIGCVARDDLGNPDSGGIIELPPSGLNIRVLFSAPLNFNTMPDDAFINFTVVREGLTNLAHYYTTA